MEDPALLMGVPMQGPQLRYLRWNVGVPDGQEALDNGGSTYRENAVLC